MINLYLLNTSTREEREYRDVLAVYISPRVKELSFCVRRTDGTASELQRFNLDEWQILCN